MAQRGRKKISDYHIHVRFNDEDQSFINWLIANKDMRSKAGAIRKCLHMIKEKFFPNGFK